MFQMLYLILLITFHGSFQSSVNAQDTSLDACSSEFHDMRTTNPQLANASVAMFQAYNQTCWNENKCSSSYEDPVSVTTRDFSGLTGPSYREMKSTCESIGTDYTLCAVTTEQRQGGFTFRDLGKPLCLPPSCSVDDVVVADTYVKDCLDASNCEILETSLDCGSRNVNPSGDCMTDVQNVHDNVEMTDFSDRIYQYVLKQCLSVVLGGSSPYCYVTASTTISVNMDMSGFHTDESFIAFEKVCHEKNGVVCQISYNEKARNDQSFLSLTFENEYEEYPICVPTSCADEDPQDIGLLLYYRNNPPEGQRRLLTQECDPETGLCTLEVDSFQCRSAAPTLPPTNTPTIVSIKEEELDEIEVGGVGTVIAEEENSINENNNNNNDLQISDESDESSSISDSVEEETSSSSTGIDNIEDSIVFSATEDVKSDAMKVIYRASNWIHYVTSLIIGFGFGLLVVW